MEAEEAQAAEAADAAEAENVAVAAAVPKIRTWFVVCSVQRRAAWVAAGMMRGGMRW